MGFTRDFSAWTKQIADAIERPEFSDFENLDNTILFGFIEGRGEARRTFKASTIRRNPSRVSVLALSLFRS